jgi:NTE family protein
VEPFVFPDVLVLAAGGGVGEAWMTGVLAGIEESAGVDFRRVEAFVGTSAGSIVSASLVAGRRPRTPRQESRAGRPPSEQADGGSTGPLGGLVGAAARGVWAASAPLAAPALAAGVPGGAIARSWMLGRVPDRGMDLDALAAEVDRWGTRWDGRLRICTVDRETGRRVVFGRPGAPAASVGEAVAASCSVPWIFRPVTIGGREYVDGGVWSITNLDTAPAGRDSQVLCLSVTASLHLAMGSAFGALRGVARAGEAVETLALRRRGASVRTIGPDAEAAAELGVNLMDERRRGAALAAGYRQGREVGGA